VQIKVIPIDISRKTQNRSSTDNVDDDNHNNNNNNNNNNKMDGFSTKILGK